VGPSTHDPGLLRKAGTLLALYFAQGLPFGFQAIALPLILRERGVSLQAIGLASLLSFPWLAKALWAPLVDRHGSAGFGRRKSWIVPMQLGLGAAAFVAGQTRDPLVLFAIVCVMNLFAATQDIAVDGLAVTWLKGDELGPANAVQVVGYKFGMLAGGGVLVWASARIGETGMFRAMSALMFVVLLVSLTIDERGVPPSPEDARASRTGDGSAVPETLAWSAIVARLRAAAAHPASRALVVVVCTYKTGEAMADAMWKPMLFDRGFTKADIGLWTGTFGMIFSLAGSASAGVLVRRFALEKALFVTAVLRAGGVLGEWWIASMPAPGPAEVIGVTCIEHALGGAITTVLFALMMRATDKTIAGTHYTLLASLEVWGKLPLGALSGFVAVQAGYGGVFGIATLLCVAFAVLAGAVRRRLAL
jgi:hypothetical protein